jgi:hypothetical protein
MTRRCDSRVYRGGFDSRGNCVVTVNGEPLPLRLDVWSHSPDGFSWGYGGSGPGQLALAMLCDHYGGEKPALALYHDFKWSVIAGLPTDDPWEMTGAQLAGHLSRIIWDRAMMARDMAAEKIGLDGPAV